MPEAHVTLVPVNFVRDPEDGSFYTSVSVATPNALVEIENLTYIAEDTMTAFAVITEIREDPSENL